MKTEKNYYDILGIPKYSSIDDVKSAYKKAVKKLHPDANIGKSEKEIEKNKELFEKIKIIYDELSDISRKKIYDMKLIVESSNIKKSNFFDDSWGKF